MKYLITGFSGFIGSHLTERLLKEGFEVIGIDRSIKWENIADFREDKNLKIYHENIEGNISDLFKDVDIVFHLAALTRPQWSINHVAETDDINVHGTVKVLEYCRDNKVKRVIFMSSSNLYGNNIYPTPEDVKPNPMNAYALSKLIGEQYCQLFEKVYGLEFNAIRPFNVYGARMPVSGIWTSAVATFIDVLKNNKPLEMFGNGQQRRDFIYIDDVIDQMLLMAHSKIHGEVFNCGSGENTSINELFDLICKIFGKTITSHRNPSQFEPDQTLANISKAKFLLKWEPKVLLEEGLRKIING